MTAPALMLLVAALKSSAPVLLVPGTFHQDEVRVRNGTSLLALCGAELKAVRVQVLSVRDELVDEGGEKSAKKVSAPCGAVFFAAHIQGLHEGKVTQTPLTAAPEQSLPSGVRHRWSFHLPAGTTLDVTDEPTGDEGGYRLVLHRGARAQVLWETAKSEGAIPELLWAGDVNGDGQPDLLLRASSDGNVTTTRLFLSGQEGTLAQVAQFSAGGC